MTTRPGTGSDAPAGRRRGRRAGGEDTRAALLAAARAVFAEQGYQGATVRVIAARAGVDAAMVNHWFGGKQGLFAAIVELPFDPAVLLDRILVGDREMLAERLIRTFIPIWDSADGAFAALVLSVASQQVAARMIGEFLTTIFARVAEVIGADKPMLRACLCATQIVGLGLVRYVLKLDPVASADVDTLVATVAPNLQRYLTGELPGPASGPASDPR
ncbi:MAG TPA: TetR family transcriptional regulator [Pseudonocardiaceae bacterium]|jgi:AcrR family transcriptional regulator|nr:TetR family transcriptional regulator [Pseudonocardiaceae bacterium]